MKLTDEEILKIAERAWQDTRLLCPIDDESIYTLTFARALLSSALATEGGERKYTQADMERYGKCYADARDKRLVAPQSQVDSGEREYCAKCDGEGVIHTGISEASTTQCRACDGTGYAPQSQVDSKSAESDKQEAECSMCRKKLMARVDHIDDQGYVHWKNDDSKGQGKLDDVTGRNRILSGTGAKNDPQLSPGQSTLSSAIGLLHVAKSPLTYPQNFAGLIGEAIDKLNWISANPESFANPSDKQEAVAWVPIDPVFGPVWMDIMLDLSHNGGHRPVKPLYFAAPATPSDKQEAVAHPDNEAVDRFAAALKEKMAASRAKGRYGWQFSDPAYLSKLLREHVEKGDPRDVANFCMMLWHHQSAIAPLTHSAEQDRIDAELRFLDDDEITEAANKFRLGNPRFDTLRCFVNYVIIVAQHKGASK